VFGQGFGGLATGTATDIGAGPVMILLAVALLLAPSPIATTGHAVLNRQLATHVSQA
jgi:hypothetical protein